jgi:hypothetical protein
MKSVHWILVAAAVVVAVVLAMPRGGSGSAAQVELFEGQEVTCPTEARRGIDGAIHVMPGDKKFNSMSDYVDYLSNLYAKGATCVPPQVRNNRLPVTGIFGGQGVGAIGPNGVAREDATRTVLDTSDAETTSAKTPIDKLDDYEYTRVEQSERLSRNGLSKQVKSDLMERNRLDWAHLPFNSEERARQEDEFVAGRMDTMYKDPKTGVFFKNMEGGELLPPDEEAARLREQKILSSYQPTDLTEHKVDKESEAVAKLVGQMYAGDKNWDPVLSKTGENKWEVTELRPKPRKEVYEDAEAVTIAMAEEKGFVRAAPSVDIVNRMQDDPYFDKSGVVDKANDRFWNYKEFNKWTPGLERMFAPTVETKEWY